MLEIILFAVAGVLLILYIMRRRARLRGDDAGR
jgi:hypothetical protein